MKIGNEVMSGDGSVVRAPDSWSKGRGFESRQEWRKPFLHRCQPSVLTLISVSVPPPCYRSRTQEIPVILPKVLVAGDSWTRMHPTYMALHEVTWHGAWLCGVQRTRRDGSSFKWHQSCNNYATLYVYNFGEYSKRAIKASHSCRILCDESTVNLFESGE